MAMDSVFQKEKDDNGKKERNKERKKEKKKERKKERKKKRERESVRWSAVPVPCLGKS